MQHTASHSARSSFWGDWRLFIPKSVTVIWQEGYRFSDFRADAISGLTVAIVALPLAMALAIASGATPDKGLLTAIVAGFLISALGGSRFQIGGPTGAFVVVVFGVIAKFGYDGLVMATMMAGLMLIAAGLLRVGRWIKYIPEPVLTGFTAGIAVIIFTSQVKDVFGLTMPHNPAEFLPKIAAMWAARDTVNWTNLALALASLGIIIGLRIAAPKAPGFLIAVALGALVTALFKLPVDTIGSRFGGISGALPMPVVPHISLARLHELVQPAFTIAFLAGVESLMSAMVADGMTGRRHRSNCELVAQGAANFASAAFGGLPATGAIARTATNIRSGARSPVSGMMHAVFLLAFTLFLGPLMSYAPLASLAAVLVVVAWNMSERRRFANLMTGPHGDRVLLLLTFALTVLVDLTVAIEVGVTLGALIFMHRMAEATAIETGVRLQEEEDVDDFARSQAERPHYTPALDLPKGVDVFTLRGPLFFGAAGRLNEAVESRRPFPKVFILRMRDVPLIDASGAGAIERFLHVCKGAKCIPILCEINARPKRVLQQMGILPNPEAIECATYEDAAEKARAALGA
jgi:SulP family sulfate permease